MTWAQFIKEFNKKFYNCSMMKEYQNELSNMKKGTRSVVDAIQRFDQLVRLCPYVAPTEED